MKIILFFLSLVTSCARQISNLTVEGIPPAASTSGGGCYAHISQTGTFRLGVLNPALSTVLQQRSPFSTASVSGGSTFHVRYLVLTPLQSSTTWSYPCFLLHRSYSQICLFHSSFGDLANCCLGEYYDVTLVAITLTYGHLAAVYGGPLGAAQTYMITYFPYIKNLPVTNAYISASVTEFGEKYCGFTRVNGLVIRTQWLIAFGISNPTMASRGATPYNYGWQSVLSHYLTATAPLSPVRYLHYENMTLTFGATVSSNLQGLMLFLPTLLVSKPWDSTGTAHPGSKVFGIALGYVTTRKLIYEHQLLSIYSAPFCSTGCPALDGASTDSLPFTQSVSYAVHSKLKTSIAPVVFPVVGPTSTLGVIKFLNGAGDYGLTDFGGINFCPFDNVEWCVAFSQTLSLVGGLQVSEEAQTLKSLEGSYGVWLPEHQICAPVCGDPIELDLLEADCLAANYCQLLVVLLPSVKAQIPFLPDAYYAVLALMSLASTALSAHFVHTFLPLSLREIPYYEHLDQWFPNYGFFSSGKGGFAFSKAAGNPLMDYMTYLTERIGAYFTSAHAPGLSSMQCRYSQFLDILSQNTSPTKFRLGTAS